ncbi:hypothetical protein EJB05_02263, partial [Eragrostis curvula]
MASKFNRMASSFTARPRANNAAAAVQLLSSSRVIIPTDDEKKPLWRYIELLEKTGKEQGGNTKSRCRLCNHTFHGSYARVKAHLLHIGGFGISSCTAVTVHVLEQLRDEVAKAQAVVARDMPRNIPLPTEGSPEYSHGPSAMWDIEGDDHADIEGGAEFLQQAQLSLDEPDLERIVEDLDALGISDNVEQSSPAAA